KSEWAIHRDYLDCLKTNDDGLPYNGIVALDEKSAVLHYEKKRTSGHKGVTFLLDSGFLVNGYASDITRTHYQKDRVPGEYIEIYRQLSQLQLKLCEATTPGKAYPDLHHECNIAIYAVLKDVGLIRNISFDQALKE